MWFCRLGIRLGLGLRIWGWGSRPEHAKYLVTGGGTRGILFDVVGIAAMKQCLCADTTKIHARTPGTTAGPLKKNRNKKTLFLSIQKDKCNIRTSVAQASESLPFPLLFFLPAGMARLPLFSPATPLSSLLLLSLLLSFSLSTSSTACLSTVGGGGRGGRPLGTVTMVTCECRGETWNIHTKQKHLAYQEHKKQIPATGHFSPSSYRSQLQVISPRAVTDPNYRSFLPEQLQIPTTDYFSLG